MQQNKAPCLRFHKEREDSLPRTHVVKILAVWILIKERIHGPNSRADVELYSGALCMG
jgi:hypothetical protein